jgi:methionyl-tRNA formyltransferase
MSPPRRLRVAYLGNDAWSVPPLKAVAESSHEVVSVVTRVPGPGRRGRDPVPTPVAVAARGIGLPLAEVDTVRSGRGLDTLAAAKPDVLAVVAYGEILPRSVLDLASLAPVNLHFSLLPALRGASPVRTALLRGLDETGVTTILMDEGLDTGDVLGGAREPILPEDDAGTLGERLARLGGRILVETLDKLSAGSVEPVPQDAAAATYAPKLTARDRRLDWTAPGESLVRVVRAFAPEPGATTMFRGSPLKIVRAHSSGASGSPGEIVEVARDSFSVAAGVGALRVVELAPAGRVRMSAAAFVNGFHPEPGERLT